MHLTKAGLDFSDHSHENILMMVAAPDWATSYAISASGGDFIYQCNSMIGLSKDQHSIPASKWVTVYDLPLFKTVQAGRAFIFQQEGITARYGGYVYAICWYDDSHADPRLIEYISVTHDEFGETVRNAVKQSEQQITAPVTEVTAISQNDWQLVVQHDPQSGERAIHYDLHMEDDRGVSYKLDGDTVFFVPYPDGYTYADKDITYQLYHYDDDYQSYVVVPLVPTPYGLRFVEDHLSPFVLMWDNPTQESPAPLPTLSPDAPSPDLPQTGDATPIEAMLALLLFSLAALAYLMRRKHSV